MTTQNRRSPEHLHGALIGYGFIMERGHAEAYRRRANAQGDVSIVAIADVCAARREAAQTAFPLARVYPSSTALLAAEAATLDFVDIATAPSTHAAIAMEALDAGVHVLCEKPLCVSVVEAEAMLSRAMARRRVLFPCHNYRHAPVIRAVRELLDANAIGNVHMATIQTFRNTHARGVAEWRPDWRREAEHSGGGIAMDHGSHSFYLLFDWLRAFPTSVSARLTTGATHDTEENFNCTINFPTGYATVHLTWTAGVRKVLYTLHGDRGAIRVEDDHVEIAYMHNDPTKSYQGGWNFERREVSSDWMDSSHAGWFNTLFDDFKVAMEADDFVGADARSALECVRLIETSYASARSQSRDLHIARSDAHVFDPTPAGAR